MVVELDPIADHAGRVLLAFKAMAVHLSGKSLGHYKTTQVGFDGALYLQHPEPGLVIEVTGVCKAQLPADLGSAQTVVPLACQ